GRHRPFAAVKAQQGLAYPVDRLARGHCREHRVVVEYRELRHGRARYPRPPMINRRPKLRIVAPNASPEEAAAVVAAVERFMRETAPRPAPPRPARNPWQQAALHEGVARTPELPVPWM